jgi:transposase
MGNPAGVKRDFDALEERRLRAVALLRKGMSQADVARELGIHRQSVYRWHRTLQEEGRGGLKKAGRAGRRPKMSDAQHEELIAILAEGAENAGYPTGLWTLARVGEVIRARFGVEYDPSQVWRILRMLGWSPQRPVGRAIERDEAAITRWKQERWPELKKTLRPKGKRSSSSTRAD